MHTILKIQVVEKNLQSQLLDASRVYAYFQRSYYMQEQAYTQLHFPFIFLTPPSLFLRDYYQTHGLDIAFNIPVCLGNKFI